MGEDISSLTVECKNSMLDPIRRVIDSALPTRGWSCYDKNWTKSYCRSHHSAEFYQFDCKYSAAYGNLSVKKVNESLTQSLLFSPEMSFNLKSSHLSKFTSNRRAKKYLNLCRIKKTVDEFEGAPPPQPTPFAGDKSPDDLRLEALLRHSNNEIANWARSHPSQVTLGSPENPLLGLTREEYYAYK